MSDEPPKKPHTVTCPLCHGTCSGPSGTCGRCGGSGTISRQ
jgi:hypothetical protein